MKPKPFNRATSVNNRSKSTEIDIALSKIESKSVFAVVEILKIIQRITERAERAEQRADIAERWRKTYEKRLRNFQSTIDRLKDLDRVTCTPKRVREILYNAVRQYNSPYGIGNDE